MIRVGREGKGSFLEAGSLDLLQRRKRVLGDRGSLLFFLLLMSIKVLVNSCLRISNQISSLMRKGLGVTDQKHFLSCECKKVVDRPTPVCSKCWKGVVSGTYRCPLERAVSNKKHRTLNTALARKRPSRGERSSAHYQLPSILQRAQWQARLYQQRGPALVFHLKDYLARFLI